MSKKVTIREVASAAGVSISTVSRYLENPKSVRPLTAYNIKNAIREMNYEPNVFAQSLKRGHSKNIGIVIPHTEFFFGDVCAVVSDYFYERGYVTFICRSDNDGDKERFIVRELLSQGVAGLIIAPIGQNTAYLRSVAQNFKNIVLFDRYYDIGCDAVITGDYDQIAYTLISFAVKKYECRPLYAMYGFEQASSIQMMTKGTEQAFEDAGRDASDLHHVYNCAVIDNMDRTIHKIQEDIRNRKHPALIFYGANFLESAVMLMNKRDRKLLHQVDMVGFAEQDTLNKLGVSIPCMIRDSKKIGIILAEHLYKKINGKIDSNGQEKICVPPVYHLEDGR
ncbi:LacI family DNA-binding transcriptional regulator [Caproicibacter sp.]|uniref:LacI family DNA-binding transcriptional regulator n=1 Tax=Caproicibacter sp. TaxID=2814884 RepID=UPI00398A11E1